MEEASEASTCHKRYQQNFWWHHSASGEARDEIFVAQNNLFHDRMNIKLIDKVKDCTKEVLSLSNIEEQVLKQKYKVEWLRLEDGNNTYFHAFLKAKRVQTKITKFKDDDGSILYQKENIEHVITKYYKKLISIANRNLTSINIIAPRKAPQLTDNQREDLIAPITKDEILLSLKGIQDISAPGIDGYKAKSFKSSQDIIKQDITSAIKEFFERKKMYSFPQLAW